MLRAAFLYTTCTLPSQSSTNLADTTGDGGAACPPAGAVNSARTEATLGESRPDLASVGTAGKSTVGVEDGVTSLDEVRVAGLALWKSVP
jgi:hypothetical protein